MPRGARWAINSAHNGKVVALRQKHYREIRAATACPL
jgi:hypothetical protein